MATKEGVQKLFIQNPTIILKITLVNNQVIDQLIIIQCIKIPNLSITLDPVHFLWIQFTSFGFNSLPLDLIHFLWI